MAAPRRVIRLDEPSSLSEGGAAHVIHRIGKSNGNILVGEHSFQSLKRQGHFRSKRRVTMGKKLNIDIKSARGVESILF